MVWDTQSRECYAALPRYCKNYALQAFYARRNRRNSPSMARFLLVHGIPAGPFLCYTSIIQQYLNSFAIRSHETVYPHHAHKPHFPIKNISISSATHHLTSLHNITRRKHRPLVRTRHPNLTTTQQDVSTGHRCAHVTPHILPQRKGRKRRGRRAHVLLRAHSEAA